jgi:hypothetical protein
LQRNQSFEAAEPAVNLVERVQPGGFGGGEVARDIAGTADADSAGGFGGREYVSLSEETATMSTPRAARACNTVQAINGLPQSSIRFLLGIPFEPPRAAITASVLRAIR